MKTAFAICILVLSKSLMAASIEEGEVNKVLSDRGVKFEIEKEYVLNNISTDGKIDYVEVAALNELFMYSVCKDQYVKVVSQFFAKNNQKKAAKNGSSIFKCQNEPWPNKDSEPPKGRIKLTCEFAKLASVKKLCNILLK